MSRITVPNDPDLSKPQQRLWTELSKHPILDGQLVEEFTLSTTTKHTVVPHSLGRAYRGFLDVRGVGLTEDQSNPNKDREIWLYREESPVLLDYQEVTGSASASQTFSNLKGDTDIVYKIVYQIEHGDGTTDELFQLRPNGLTTNQDGQRHLTQNATSTAADLTGIPLYMSTDSGFGVAHFYVKTGTDRYCIAHATADTNSFTYVLAGVWDETATEVTSLEITSTNTLIDIGSKFWLYALHSRATKASVWVF